MDVSCWAVGTLSQGRADVKLVQCLACSMFLMRLTGMLLALQLNVLGKQKVWCSTVNSRIHLLRTMNACINSDMTVFHAMYSFQAWVHSSTAGPFISALSLLLYPPDNWHHGQHEEQPAPAPCKVRRDLRHAGWLRADPAVHAADGWQCDQAAGGFAWLGWGQSGPGIHRWSNSKRRVLQVRSRGAHV